MFALNKTIDRLLIFINIEIFFFSDKRREVQQNKNVLMIRKNYSTQILTLL